MDGANGKRTKRARHHACSSFAPIKPIEQGQGLSSMTSNVTPMAPKAVKTTARGRSHWLESSATQGLTSPVYNTLCWNRLNASVPQRRRLAKWVWPIALELAGCHHRGNCFFQCRSFRGKVDSLRKIMIETENGYAYHVYQNIAAVQDRPIASEGRRRSMYSIHAPNNSWDAHNLPHYLQNSMLVNAKAKISFALFCNVACVCARILAGEVRRIIACHRDL